MALKFSRLAEVFSVLEHVASGNKMREILSDFLKTVPLSEIDKVVYLMSGSIGSNYDDVIFAMADKMVLKAIAHSANASEESAIKLFKKTGDIGIVAEQMVSGKHSKLSLPYVFEQLHLIAKSSGPGSQERKTVLLSNLLSSSLGVEARYIARIVLGQLRLGVGDMTLLDSLAIAFTGTKSARKKLEHAYNICPDIGVIAKTLAEKGLGEIEKIDVVLGRPIQMMLCQRVKLISDIPARMGFPVVIEEKYDGERVQAHKSGSKVVLFSRKLDNISSQFPDVVESIRTNVKAKNCIIEGEIMAVGKNNNFLKFQVLMQRKRKHGVSEMAKKIAVCPFLFDILYLNGRSYLHEDYQKRHSALVGIIRQSSRLQLANQVTCYSVDCIEDFFTKSIKHGGEGIVAKSCKNSSVYQPGTRGWLWIKWKPEYSKQLQDTFDLVVVGAFWGRGRRSGKYGALLCAAYNSEKDRFETFCKLGSGFTDADLNSLQKKFRIYESKSKPALVDVARTMAPDVWIRPAVVVEVLGSEITLSPNHVCGLEKGLGLALRFPRFVKFRPDKSQEQATSVKEIIPMYGKKKK